MVERSTSNWITGNKKFYDQESELKYSQSRSKTFFKSYLKINERLPLIPGYPVLDIGCGSGEMVQAHFINSANGVGVDISFKSLQVAKKLFPKGKFVCGDIHHLPFKNKKFGAATAISSMEFSHDKTTALNELKRVSIKNMSLYLDVRISDFIVYNLVGPIRSILEKIKMIEPMPLENFSDLSRKEWSSLFENNGFEVKKEFKTIWPWNFGSFKTRLKNLIIEMVKMFLPKHYNYMIGFGLKKNET